MRSYAFEFSEVSFFNHVLFRCEAVSDGTLNYGRALICPLDKPHVIVDYSTTDITSEPVYKCTDDAMQCPGSYQFGCKYD